MTSPDPSTIPYVDTLLLLDALPGTNTRLGPFQSERDKKDRGTLPSIPPDAPLRNQAFTNNTQPILRSMMTEPPYSARRTSIQGIAATLAVHLALLLCWHLARQDPAATGAPDRIQWINIPLAKTERPSAPPPPPRERQEREAVRGDRAARQPAPVRTEPREVAAALPAQVREVAAAPPAQVIAPASTPTETAAEPAPAKSGYDILQQARKDMGKISKDLGKEFPGAKIKAPPDTPQIRLEKGIELAHELAPPKWHEAPKIKEIVDPGGYGRKRYRVITANGTYCITYESNHAPDGIDVISRGMQQKKTNCPKDELPPTTQKGL